ncbi:MAG: DUF4126 domain-containing protein [Pyrinomonadaceae bacterium]
MNLIQILGLAAGSAWTSGINLYATVAVLGLLEHYKLVRLPGGLHVLDNWLIIGVAVGLYCVEFFADKVPYVDTVWDAVHTFIRVPAGAVLAYAATNELNPTVRVLAVLMGGTVALSSHGTKATVRAAANVSPEPVSNWVLSVIEDLLAVGGVVLSVVAPLVALFLVAAFLVLFFWLLPKVLRRIGRMLAAARDFFTGRGRDGVRAALLLTFLTASVFTFPAEASAKPSFVTVKGHQLALDDRPYYFPT